MSWKITGAPGKGDDLLYSQAGTPTLDLRFASNKSLVDYISGQNLINFTRASNATYVDSQGIIRTAPTNLLLRSQEFDSGWTLNGMRAFGSGSTANATTAPDGTTTADLLTEDASTGVHNIVQSVSGTSGTTYTFSVFVKVNSGTRNLRLFVPAAILGGSGGNATFDLTAFAGTGFFGTVASQFMQAYPNGWYRVGVVTTAATANATGNFTIALLSGASSNYTGDNTSGVFLWGAQLEVGSTATEYIPTSATINGAPRITHDSDGKCLGLLVEEARTNLLKYSEEADNPAWNIISSSVTVDPNVVTAPDGTQTADKVKEAAITGGHSIEFTGFAFEAGVTYACSCFIKAAERSRIRLTFPVVFTNRLAYFDLNPNSYQVINDGGTTASITPVGNDWFRVAAVSTATTTSSGARIGITIVDTGTNVNYTGDGTSGIYVWGAQLEAGAFPTSYIKTEGSTATRAADIATITGANFSGWYRQDEGSLYTDTINREAFPGVNVFPYILQIDDGTNNNRLSHESSVLSGGYRYNLPVTSGGVSQGELGQPGFASGSARWASAFRANDFALALSLSPGVVSTRASGTLPNVMSRMRIGVGFGKQFTGTIARLAYFDRRLPNPTLQEITQ